MRHWKLNFIALIFICLFVFLGHWQQKRAQEKAKLLNVYHERMRLPALEATNFSISDESRFRLLTLTGQFDHRHTILLDNKIFHGKIGYEVYTPFISPELNAPILVDRGFIAIQGDRNHLPVMSPLTGESQVTGLLNLPPRYLALGNLYESKEIKWPLRVQYINLSALSPYTGPLYSPYVLLLSPTHPAAFENEWQITVSGPEKHQAYAIQWFAFAITLLIISIALNRRASRNKTTHG